MLEDIIAKTLNYTKETQTQYTKCCRYSWFILTYVCVYRERDLATFRRIGHGFFQLKFIVAPFIYKFHFVEVDLHYL